MVKNINPIWMQSKREARALILKMNLTDLETNFYEKFTLNILGLDYLKIKALEKEFNEKV